MEPSSQFIRTYFSAFDNDPIFACFKDDSMASNTAEETEKHQEESLEKEKIEDVGKSDTSGTGDTPVKTRYEVHQIGLFSFMWSNSRVE